MLALRSEGFGGDFRSGYEDAFKLIMDLMEPPETKMKGTINILGARWDPTPTEFNWDMDEIERLLGEVGIKINAIIAGGCTVEQIKHAREVELNTLWCFDWGQKLGDLMQERFGIPYSKTGQPYGPEATKEWLLGVATSLGMEAEAVKVIEQEIKGVESEIQYLRKALSGKTAVVEISEFPGPIRALSLARMAADFGAHPVVINVHHILSRNVCPASSFFWKPGFILKSF